MQKTVMGERVGSWWKWQAAWMLIFIFLQHWILLGMLGMDQKL